MVTHADNGALGALIQHFKQRFAEALHVVGVRDNQRAVQFFHGCEREHVLFLLVVEIGASPIADGIEVEHIIIQLAGALAGAAASLYWLAGNTEFFWSTYQALPGVGFNGIPVALLAANNPIGVVFSGMFMSMLDICGLQLKNLTGFNEYITDVIIAVIVYLAAFSLVIKMLIGKIVAKRGKEAGK
jgi:hypothetical protein